MKNEYELRGLECAIFIKSKYGEEMETIVDSSDLGKLLLFNKMWTAYYDKSTNYYVKTTHEGKVVFLHRFLTSAPSEMVVDHINHDCLDNRLGNLRVVDRSANMQNRKGAQRNSKSNYRSVSWNKNSKKWLVYLTVNGRKKYFGGFHDIEEANRVAIEARKREYPFSENDKRASA